MGEGKRGRRLLFLHPWLRGRHERRHRATASSSAAAAALVVAAAEGEGFARAEGGGEWWAAASLPASSLWFFWGEVLRSLEEWRILGRQTGWPKKNREKTEKLDKFYQQVLNFLFSLFEVGRHTWLLHYYLKSTVVILSFLPFSCIYKKYSSKRTVIPKTPSDEIYFLCLPRDGVSLLPGTMTSQDNNVVILRFLPI